MKRETWRHHEWLSLLEISGPFLSIEVLKERLQQGLEAIDASMRKRLRVAYDEWDEACWENDPQLGALHEAWVKMVFHEALEYEESDFVRAEGDEFTYRPMEHDGEISADFAIVREGEKKSDFFVVVVPLGTDLEAIPTHDAWPATILERVTKLCRDKEVRFALVTNGERWTLVNAPRGSMSSTVSWYARIWFQEPVTLRAFVTLFGVRRLYGPAEERLESLLDESLEKHEEVTDTLGEQVRRAVEVLVQSLDRADRDRNRELLVGVKPETLYEAGLTVMMRLVFALSAEERGLLLLGDPIYDAHYAVSTLRTRLAEEADRHGAEVLERRYDAWSRLLALFRAIYGGIAHESLRMPALGGSLFDPDRFPFLEGRSEGSRWREESAKPLPIDNRTVLLLLRALQVLERSGGALLLSYKALDVEQIGHVYEGLLEYTVRRMPALTLGLKGSKNAKNSTVTLEELESLMQKGLDETAKALKELTGRTVSPLKKELAKEVDEELFGKVLLACGNDTDLAERVRPFAHLLAEDAWGEFLVYEENSFAVVPGSDRSATGAHYTPKSLTEAVVAATLEPVLYEGGADGRPKEEWRLAGAETIVSLKICDPAMGSGAFLVQACRYLAERLVEAWGVEERKGHYLTAEGEVVDALGDREPLSTVPDDRLILARRMVAERCIYGVDLNPLAVELAKLSLWLVTLSKGRPFGFLDHSLRVGDSLLGIDDVEKLVKFSTTPDEKVHPSLFAKDIEEKIREALRIREEIRDICVLDIEDVEAMKTLDAKAREHLAVVESIADAMIGEVLRTGGKKRELESALERLKLEAAEALDGDEKALERIRHIARDSLSIDLPEGSDPRRPFHWPLAFPEVFVEGEGFDAIVGNPPFLGGKKISTHYGGAYASYIRQWIGGGRKGSADFVAFFFLRAYDLLKKDGIFGLLATNTLGEGGTKSVGLGHLLLEGATIFAAYPNEPWPGNAAVVTSRVHLVKSKEWKGELIIDDKPMSFIGPDLTPEDARVPYKLKVNAYKAFIGTTVHGKGFIVKTDFAQVLLKKKPWYSNILMPYLTGRDLNSIPTQEASRYVINFWDWPLEKAKEYPELFEILERTVKPERDALIQKAKTKSTQQIHEYDFFKFWDKRHILYHAIGRGNNFCKHPIGNWPEKTLEKILITSLVSKYVTFSILPNNVVFSHKLCVLSFEKFEYLALMQSSISEQWFRKFSSSLGGTMNFSPSDSFETFPFPEPLHPDWRRVDWNDPIVQRLEEIGTRYHERRKEVMLERWVGLTDLYNLFHDPEVGDEDIEELRRLHIEMDEAVKAAYGWDDLDLGHNFHKLSYLPENDRTRFTVSEPARLEILKRLLDLNEERHRQEVEAGLWDKKGTKGKKAKKSDGGLF